SGANVVVTCPALAERLREAIQTAGMNPAARLLVIDEIESQIEAAQPLRTVHDSGDHDLALLLYTSGTTGNPKGVMLTHHNLRTTAVAVAELYKPEPLTMTLHVLPLSHSFGVLCMNLEAVYGLRSVILPRFETQRVFEAIQQFRVKRFSAVPTMFIALCHF